MSLDIDAREKHGFEIWCRRKVEPKIVLEDWQKDMEHLEAIKKAAGAYVDFRNQYMVKVTAGSARIENKERSLFDTLAIALKVKT